MQFEKYTDRARGLIQAAQTIALRESHQQITPEHVLKALLDDSEGLCANLIRAAGGQPGKALADVTAAVDKLPKVEGSGVQVTLSQATGKVFAKAEEVAQKAGDSYVTTERLLMALALEGGTAKLLKNAGLTPQNLNTAISELRKGRKADTASAEEGYYTRR